MLDPERTIEFEFVRATENAALNAMRFIGQGDKNAAEAAASAAFLSPCPMNRMALRAAFSVARTNSNSIVRSGSSIRV